MASGDCSSTSTSTGLTRRRSPDLPPTRNGGSRSMLEKVISGGQTGADQGALRSAKKAGIATGGWMPKGFLTEDGPRPEFAEWFGMQEHWSPRYPPRTEMNVADSDVTLWFGVGDSAGYWCTAHACRRHERRLWNVGPFNGCIKPS